MSWMEPSLLLQWFYPPRLYTGFDDGASACKVVRKAGRSSRCGFTSVCSLNKVVLKLWPQVPWQDVFMSEILECGDGFWIVLLVGYSDRSCFGWKGGSSKNDRLVKRSCHNFHLVVLL